MFRRTIGAIATSACLAWVIVTMAALRRPLPALIGPPVTVPFDTRLSTGSDDIPLSELSRRGGSWDPEQIHLALAGVVSLKPWTSGGTLYTSVSTSSFGIQDIRLYASTHSRACSFALCNENGFKGRWCLSMRPLFLLQSLAQSLFPGLPTTIRLYQMDNR